MNLKKLLLGLLVLLILIAIPTTVFLVQKQQELRSRAAPATTLSLIPASSTHNVGEAFSLDIVVDTGANVVSAAEIHLAFDKTKLAAQEITAGPFLPVPLVPGSVDNQQGTALITLGTSPASPATGKGTAAKISFKGIATTGTTPTQVSFTAETQVAAIEEGANVLVGTTPASVTITAAVTVTPTPTLPPGVTPTPTPTGAQNPAPTCTSLTATPATGTAPLTVTLTANGADQNNDIVSALFTFGDGQTQTVDKNIGQAGSIQVSHVYQNIGNVTASAILRDRDGATSTACTAALTILAAGTPTPTGIGGPRPTATPTPTGPTATPTAIPTPPVTGDITPTNILAIAGAALVIIGAILFFAL